MNPYSSLSTADLLQQARSGDDAAADALYARVYDELRRLAHVVRPSNAPDTVNTTALVHEAYEHLRPDEGLNVENKQHFFRLAARAMRQVIAREIRHRDAQKRGGDAITVPFYDRMFGTERPLDDILAIEDALAALEAMNPRQVRVVECRFYAGLSVAETARALDVSTATVKRDWRAARAWLLRYLRPED